MLYTNIPLKVESHYVGNEMFRGVMLGDDTFELFIPVPETVGELIYDKEGNCSDLAVKVAASGRPYIVSCVDGEDNDGDDKNEIYLILFSDCRIHRSSVGSDSEESQRYDGCLTPVRQSNEIIAHLHPYTFFCDERVRGTDVLIVKAKDGDVFRSNLFGTPKFYIVDFDVVYEVSESDVDLLYKALDLAMEEFTFRFNPLKCADFFVASEWKRLGDLSTPLR